MIQSLDLFGAPTLHRAATFAAPGIRKRLSRWWRPGPRALVIGCNPSTADAEKDDQTSLWWNRWFEHWGFNGYDAVNLYPFCTSSRAECRKRVENAMSGGDWHDRDAMFANRDYVALMAKDAEQVFVCWGNIAWDDLWIDSVVEEIHTGFAPYPDLWCWGTTKSGAPTHPAARGKHRLDSLVAARIWQAA